MAVTFFKTDEFVANDSMVILRVESKGQPKTEECVASLIFLTRIVSATQHNTTQQQPSIIAHRPAIVQLH
ncbi:hypothetical protein ABKV19_000489 [Rosa sericea]